MYRFSRSIYRELAPRAIDDSQGVCRQKLLESCEKTMARLAQDRRYFARPAKSLFSEVRTNFPLSEQHHVYRVIDRNIRLAVAYLELMPGELGLDGVPRQCRASTRRGTPCQREPLPNRDYCPSHKHLEEPLEASTVAA